MFFPKNLIISSLFITVSTSLDLGEECVDFFVSGLEGRCQSIFECNYVLKYRKVPDYCEDSINLVCCPPVTFKGDECFDITSRLDGRCQNLLECNYALKYRTKPRDCDDSTVCCPPVELRISEKVCFDYFRHINYSFDTERSISDYDYNGTDGVQDDNADLSTKDLRKPSHMAAIGTTVHSSIKWICFGSIISPFFILSAANCDKDQFLNPANWVRIRDLENLLQVEGIYVESNHQDFRIVESFIHPSHTSSSPHNDIALFKLEKEIIFGHDYQPACLHTARNVPEIMETLGLDTETPKLTETLNFDAPNIYLEEELHVFRYEVCVERSRDRLPNGVVDELHICTWDAINREVEVKFYTGGPLQYKVEGFGNIRGHYVVAGVKLLKELYDYDSAIVTQLFTRVSAYLDWIEEIVWENEIEPETVTFVFRN